MSLLDKRVVVTRAAAQADGLCAALESVGARLVRYPCVAIAPPANDGPLRNALDRLSIGEFGWLVLTSVNAAEAVAAVAGNRCMPDSLRIATVGPATEAAAARLFSREADFVAAVHVSQELAASIPLAAGDRVLIPQSDRSRARLANDLRRRGANVEAVQAYRTVCGAGGEDLPAMLEMRQIDAITLTSGSCALNLHRRLSSEGGTERLPPDVVLACIGPSTAEVLTRELGYPHCLVAAEQTIGGLINALDLHFKARDAR